MKNASIPRAPARTKQPGAPHGCSLLAGRGFVICAMLVVVGCATAPPAPQIVKVPVYVPCVTGAPLVAPSYEFDKLGPATSDGDKVLALARDWPRGREYEGRLEAVIAGCR